MPEESTIEATVAPDIEALAADDLSQEDFEAARETGKLPAKEEDTSGAGDDAPQDGGGDSRAKTAQESETGTQDQEQAKGESGEKPAQAGEPPKKGEGQQKTNLQKRFDELTRDKRRLEERLAALEGEAGGGKAGDKGPGKTDEAVAADPNRRPEPGDFDTYEEYVDKLTDWKLHQRDQADAAKAEKQAIAENWRANEPLALEAHPDFEEVMKAANVVRLPDYFDAAIVTSERPAELAYALASDLDRLARIATLPPVQALREIGRVEASLPSPKKPAPGAQPTPAPRKPSAAPKPATAITGGSGRSAAFTMDDPQMPYEEWEKRRDEQILARRR